MHRLLHASVIVGLCSNNFSIAECHVPMEDSIRVIAIHGPVNSEKFHKLACHNGLSAKKSSVLENLKIKPIELKTGKYEIVKPETHYFQRNILQQTFSGSLPLSITRIGDAVHYLLKNTGYRVIPPERSECDAMYVLFQLPLPAIQRSYDNAQLSDILITLGGKAFIAKVDEIRREVGYCLAPNFTLKPQSIQQAKKIWLTGVRRAQQ